MNGEPQTPMIERMREIEKERARLAELNAAREIVERSKFARLHAIWEAVRDLVRGGSSSSGEL